ncbi:MAG TPA: HK97 family phage prohead protease [Caulobacteraceae bacterium]|jgi:hypothetical protein
MTDLNPAGLAYARSLIAAGKVDRASPWSFSAEDGDALLGQGGDNWGAYGEAHLGLDPAAADKTRAYWQYPVVKDGKVYRAGVIAAKQRASAEGAGAVEAAAAELLDKIDAAGDAEARLSALGFETKIAPFEFKFAEENGTRPGQFDGYGSVFNVLDGYGDVMMPGAFDATLAKARATGRMPKMLLNHGGLAPGMQATPTDLLPIGSWTALSPDTQGLATRGQLINLDTEHGKRIYGAMKAGELTDQSIGYMPRRFTRPTKAGDPRRRLTEVHLNEISPVTFGANPMARITAVKSFSPLFAQAFDDMRGLEAALRDEGFSRTDAAKGARAFKAYLLRDAAEGPDQEPRDAATSDDVRALAARLRAALA